RARKQAIPAMLADRMRGPTGVRTPWQRIVTPRPCGVTKLLQFAGTTQTKLRPSQEHFRPKWAPARRRKCDQRTEPHFPPKGVPGGRRKCAKLAGSGVPSGSAPSKVDFQSTGTCFGRKNRG